SFPMLGQAFVYLIAGNIARLSILIAPPHFTLIRLRHTTGFLAAPSTLLPMARHVLYILLHIPLALFKLRVSCTDSSVLVALLFSVGSSHVCAPSSRALNERYTEKFEQPACLAKSKMANAVLTLRSRNCLRIREK